MDANSVYVAAIGGAGLLAAMWWWHRRSKALRVTADAKNKANEREEKRAKKLQAVITEAEALRDEGRLQQAAAQYLAAVKIASKYYGKVSLPLLRTLQAYSVVLFALDRPAAVLTVLTQCVYLARRLPQVSLDDRISLMLQLGDALIRTNRDTEAEKVIRKAVELIDNPPAPRPEEMEQSTPTPDGSSSPTPEVSSASAKAKKRDSAVNDKKRAYAFWNLALIKSRLLDRVTAEDYAKKAVELFQNIYGKTHPDTLSVELTLANILYDQGQKAAALLRMQSIWGETQASFNEKTLQMSAFLSFGHLLGLSLIEREETKAAQLILQSAINAAQLPKLKPVQYYVLLSDLAALYWEMEGKEEDAQQLEDTIANTLTSVADHLPLSHSRTMRTVSARITPTGVYIIDFALNAMQPASREPLYFISPEMNFEVRFEHPSNPKERILLKRKVGQSTFITVHSPLLNGFRHAKNYIVDIKVKDKDGKVVGHLRQLVRYVAQFVLPAIVPGSPEECFTHVAEEIRVSQNALPKIVERSDPKEIAKEEETLTKLLLELDAIADDKHREHRKALIDTIQQLLQKVDAAKARRTSD